MQIGGQIDGWVNQSINGSKPQNKAFVYSVRT